MSYVFKGMGGVNHKILITFLNKKRTGSVILTTGRMERRASGQADSSRTHPASSGLLSPGPSASRTKAEHETRSEGKRRERRTCL